MARSNQRGSSNNNPEGRNQHSRNWMDSAKDRPMTAAAAAAAAVGAGVFLWSRRNQISDQLGHMSDQISEWSENMRSQQGSSSSMESGGFSSNPMGAETGRQPEMAGAGTSATTGSRSTGGRSGKAQSGQNMSPSRTSNPTPGL